MKPVLARSVIHSSFPADYVYAIQILSLFDTANERAGQYYMADPQTHIQNYFKSYSDYRDCPRNGQFRPFHCRRIGDLIGFLK